MANFLKKALAAVLPPSKKNAAAEPVAPAQKTPGPDPSATTLLMAWKSPGINPRLLVAYKPGTDPTNPNNLVTVNVRNNTNFLPHMRLRTQHVEGTIYNLVGPLPRWRGCW